MPVLPFPPRPSRPPATPRPDNDNRCRVVSIPLAGRITGDGEVTWTGPLAPVR